MSTRRDALRILAALPAVASAGQETHEVETQPGHLHEGAAIKVPVPSKPAFFQPAEYAAVEAMTERIIPRSDSPGAKDAGVALLIDRAIVAGPALGVQYRAGIADLNALAFGSFSKNFVELTAEQQDTVLLLLSSDPESPHGRFFTLVKNMTIDAYYKTEAGLKTELGWHGNTYLDQFPGCDHPEHQA